MYGGATNCGQYCGSCVYHLAHPISDRTWFIGVTYME